MAAVNLVQLSEAVAHNRFSAEFFDPGYVFEPAAGSEWAPIGRVLKKCEYGLSISMNSIGKGFPIFRMNELDRCFALRPEKFANISQSEFNASALQENDVLFNRTNSFEFVGRTGIVKDQTDCTFASYLIRLVPDDSRLLPEFLTVYLNTQFGIGQIKRRAMRSINQANVSGSEVRKILIPLVDLSVQQEVADLVNTAFSKQRDGLSYFTTAQSLLEKELGLDKLTFQRPAGYIARFSDLETSRRSDAEFFHVRYEPYLSAVGNYRWGWQPLNKLTKQTLSNFDRRQHSGDVSYIEIGDVSVSNGSYSANSIAARDLPANAKIELYGGEILVSQVRPTRGAIAIIDDKLFHQTVCSGAFYVCTANEVSHREIIWLYLRCMKNVFEKFCGGTSYPTIDSRYIARFPVPLFDDELASRIQTLVVQAKSAQVESLRLLDQAKTRVEQLIEAAIQL